MLRWLNRNVIGDAEAPRFVDIRPGGVKRAREIVGRALTILEAEFVIPAPQLLVLRAVNKTDSPTSGAVDFHGTTADRVPQISASCIRVIKPEREFAERRFHVVEP